MIESGAVLDVAELGDRLEVRTTSRETGGELVEFDVVGRARGFLTGPDVDERQVERHDVIAGSMRVVIAGKETVLGAGETIEVPAGAVRAGAAGVVAGYAIARRRPSGRSWMLSVGRWA